MIDAITQFRGEYRWLSNFHQAVVVFEGQLYPTVENAYQAAKTEDAGMRRIMQRVSPGEAKKMGQKLNLRPGWDSVKYGVMLELVRKKFTLNADLKRLLLATGDCHISEGNTWGDTYWGVDLATGVGSNHLGRVIMTIRNEL